MGTKIETHLVCKGSLYVSRLPYRPLSLSSEILFSAFLDCRYSILEMAWRGW